MGISADELVRLLDEYMSNDGFYMKPKVDGGGNAIGEKKQQETQVFSGRPKVDCATCADIPTLMDVVPDNE